MPSGRAYKKMFNHFLPATVAVQQESKAPQFMASAVNVLK